MLSTGPGFCVLEKRDPQASADPKIVIYRLDPATLDIVELRGSPEQLLGFPAGDWHGPKFWCGRVHPDDLEAARRFFAGLARLRRNHELEYRVLDAAGRTVWVHEFIEVGRDARGDTEIRGILLDITRRVAQEADIRKVLALRNELLRIVAEELAQPVRAISVYGKMLERHLAAQRDDVGSDYAVALRGSVQRLDGLLAQLMPIAHTGDMSFDEMNACLAAIRGTERG